MPARLAQPEDENFRTMLAFETYDVPVSRSS